MDDPQFDTTRFQAWFDRLSEATGPEFESLRSEIINHASSRLETLVRKMLRSFPRLRRWEQTGDVLQNSLLRLHHALSTVRPETPRQFFGLAATQIQRELIDLTRHHFGPLGAASQHHTDRYDPATEARSTVDRQPDTASQPESLEEWTEFHEAVSRLPELEREVFQLHWYEGFDHQTVASMLGVTDRTVKNRWRSAKILLQQMIHEKN